MLGLGRRARCVEDWEGVIVGCENKELRILKTAIAASCPTSSVLSVQRPVQRPASKIRHRNLNFSNLGFF